MQQFEDSTLWRLSAYERMRLERSSTAFAQLGENTVLPTTLVSDLRQLDLQRESHDVLEVLAACLRHRQSALLCLRYEDLVWPLTVFPLEGLYHSPRALARAKPQSLAQSVLLSCDPPGLRPPGHWMHERIGRTEHYHELKPLLWNLALIGPRTTLLREIGGPAAYRVLLSKDHRPDAPGAVGAAAERLRSESASLREIARWPGMTAERAARLLNALYMIGGLMVMRSHPAARPESDFLGRLLRFGRAKR
ncbi:MAG TPA: hypothetical protein P5163_19095 [Rubrivivax sp.]|nr:hypothetical protein [Pseudomonadota bacterium]MCW5638232.1 hypothetical protein [Rubrivivax sp.]HOW48197.1 hypothetical protein [Rubrivivax sp.]HRY88388.1 hypothetical protein [Rubrivivax sp.]HRZ62699.1 hypothetical protein [Rubrivivax sp.]